MVSATGLVENKLGCPLEKNSVITFLVSTLKK